MADQMNPEQLRTLLEDTQASLAAAFARIEAFRLREKHITNELAQLRQQVHGQSGSSCPAPAPAAPPTAAGTAGSNAQQQTTATLSRPSYTNIMPSASTSSAPSKGPVYVSEHPVEVIAGGKKVPAAIVLAKDYVDFVEVKARIRQEQFVGITTLKQSGVKPKAPEAYDAAATATGPEDEDSSRGVWQVLWNVNDVPQRLAFEASQATRGVLHKHTERWLGEDSSAAEQEPAASTSGGDGELAVPRNLILGEASIRLVGETSQILSPAQFSALASALPPLERMKPWVLSYSTKTHGISLATLYRRQAHSAPSLLVIKDFGGYVFGCYTPDSWRVSPRFYGSGETFVFQLEPHRVMYPWKSKSKVKNDFFMYGTPECLAVGGAGHFGVWLDAELLHGSSGICDTFGSPCLAHNEEFKVAVVELWQASS